MNVKCPYCASDDNTLSGDPKFKRAGRFYRKSDSRWVQRFLCLKCKKGFSLATFHPCFTQNKRHKNHMVRQMLCSGVSQRRISRILNITRRTVVRKLLFLSAQAALKMSEKNGQHKPCEVMEFDDLETFEHTKCKPLSVTLAVESGSRRILGFRVARMPAKGKLVHIARKKYGRRVDERADARKKLFETIQPLVAGDALIKSDQNPHYPEDVRKFFPRSKHEAHKGRRGSIVGQGELKKIRFDPLFSLNHTCAMLRANINRLFRKTWCTTKRPDRLSAHIALFSEYHNAHLKKKPLAI